MTTQESTKLLLVRHGESQVTVKQILGGEKTDTGLSPLGRLQAEALSNRLSSGDEPAVDALYSSTLPRAIETAEILSSQLGDLVLQLDEDLVEHRPGEADGMRFADIEGHYGPIDFRTRPHRPLAPGAESSAQFFYRASRGLDRVVSQNLGKCVVVACHGGVIDVAFRYFLDLPRNGAFDLHTLNTSITEFRVEDFGPQRGRWRLQRYNDHAHLAGLPTETIVSE